MALSRSAPIAASKYCGLKTAGITWNDGRNLSYARISKGDHETLKARLATAEADLAVLSGLVHYLYHSLNESLPTVRHGEVQIVPQKAM